MAANFELMPLIDNRRPPGAQLVGWASRCLRCPAPVHKTETTEAASAWMDQHRRGHATEATP